MSVEEIKALERHILEVMNEGKKAVLAALDEYFVTNYVYHSADGMDIRGLEENKQYFSALYDAFPDIHFTLDDLIVEGDKAVMRYTITGTHQGKFMDIPPTNKKFQIEFCTVATWKNGEIVEERLNYDLLGMLKQIGVM